MIKSCDVLRVVSGAWQRKKPTLSFGTTIEPSAVLNVESDSSQDTGKQHNTAQHQSCRQSQNQNGSACCLNIR